MNNKHSVMSESFRLKRSVQILGIVATVLFVAAALFSASIFFLDDPVDHGFRDGPSAAIVGGMGITVFGSMALLSVYLLVAYYVESVTIAETTVAITSVFQDRQFETFQVDRLIWKAPRGGTILFHVLGQKTRLDLASYGSCDRLRIIRWIRARVPTERQEGWPLFCQVVALPLHDGIAAGPAAPESLSNTTCGRILVTRKRYDRQFLILFPASVAVAVALWLWTGLPRLVALPLILVPFWLLLRFVTPREGQRELRLTARPQGWVALYACAVLVTSSVALKGLRAAGVNVDFVPWVMIALLGPVIPLMLLLAYRQEKTRKQKGVDDAAGAVERWEQGELLERSQQA